MRQNSPSEQIIFTTKDTSGKIYIREQYGHFQRLRRRLNIGLMSLFLLLPWLNYQGSQAIQVDVAQLRLFIFGWVLVPQDFLIIALLFTLAAFALFYITKLYGRIWCGYTCPQTVWTLLFVWLERRIEGSHSQSKALDNAPWHRKKISKKLLKHTSWLLVSLITSLAFIAYFVPARELYSDFFSLNSSVAVYGWVCFFAVCTYINAGLIREKMCLHMCPYARFQSAMFEPATKLVTYDKDRGEQRGARKRQQPKPAHMGDCVDCGLCVQVCPVGIDIRQGLQYECINCGLCIDACDHTMRQFDYPTGLIRYQGEKVTQSLWRRHLGYGSAITLTVLAMFAWGYQWQNTELSISRDRQALYRINSDEMIENTFTLNISNKQLQPRQYQLQVAGLSAPQLIGVDTIALNPAEQQQHVISIAVATRAKEAYSPFTLQLTDTLTGETFSATSRFYYPR